MATSVRRLLIGPPLENARAAHEKLPPFLALPVFASDALSSVAYATGEIMAALLLAGSAALHLTFPVSTAIAALLVIVATSYRQTVLAYPGGGGAYIVARDNLGIVAAQIAGAALMIDYVLTVAVSISSGVAAIDSLMYVFRGQHIHLVLVCILILAFITVINLRGVRESGAIFAAPTYAFIAIVFLLIGAGIWQLLTGHLGVTHSQSEFLVARVALEEHATVAAPLQSVGLFLILHAFASGCAAMTGVEAVSNGVTAFKEPSSRNAAKTMIWMAGILGFMFLGLSFLAVHCHVLPETAIGFGRETTISQIGRTILGKGFLYWWLQIATALILVLAANTSFAGFPRLGALIARDGFLPKQLSNVGNRLVFDRGIQTLAVLSGALIWWRKADVHMLIPLYAVGVFLSFTISQTGMVLRWRKLRSPGWHVKAFVNGVGAVVTFLVLGVIAYVKFIHGAWLVVVLIPFLVLVFLRIHAHYSFVDKQMGEIGEDWSDAKPPKHAVLVLVPGPTRGAIRAVRYARSLAGDCRAIHVEVNPEKTPHLRDVWVQRSDDVPLVILESPFRDIVGSLMAYLDEVQMETPNTQITVVIPEFVANRWWQNLLHGHMGLVLKFALLGRKNVVVTNVRYHLESESVSLRDMFDVQKDYAGHM